jgi:LPS-assembly protein
MQLNLETKKGTLEKARVFIKTGNVYINGSEIEKTGESQYRIKKGKFTTCGWDRPEWTFTSDEVDITVQGYARTKSTTFHILGVPVFYVPWGIFPVKTDRASGFLMPEIGSSSEDGMKFKLSYFWAISKDTDATLSGEYIGNRGVNWGAEYRYALREDLKGQLEGNIIDDTKYGHTRYQYKIQHEQVFLKDFKLKANVWQVSDNDYLEDFGKTVMERSESQIKSTVFVEKPLSRSLLTGGVSQFKNLLMADDSSVFQYYPEITYFTEYMPIMGGRMYLDLNSSLTNFYRDKGPTFTRITMDPSLRLPFSYKGLNTLFSATMYQSGYAVNRDGNYSNHRQTFRFDSDVNMQFLRNYFPGWSWMKAMQSVLKPVARYTFIPATGYGDVPQIDAYDRISQTNIITYGLNHYLYEADELGNKREISIFEVYQTYGISGDLLPSEIYKGSGSRFSDVDLRFTFNPISQLALTHESVFSVAGKGIKILRNGMTYTQPKVLGLTVAHNYSTGYENPLTGVFTETDDSTNQIFVGAIASFWVLEAGYQVRYEFTQQQWIDTEYSLKYKPGCWSVTLAVAKTTRPDDTSFRLSFDLTGITSR